MLYLGRQNRAILSADEIGRFLHDTRQIFVGRFCRQIKSGYKIAQFCRSSDIPLTCPKATNTPHMHDKYLIYFDLQASLIWFAQQKVLKLKLHDPKVHDMKFRKNNIQRKHDVIIVCRDHISCVFDGLTLTH